MRTLDLRDGLIDISLPSVKRELIEFTRLNVPDPNWLFVDKAGHEHRWDEIGIIPKSEKIHELLDAFHSKEECLITLVDGVNPIVGKVVSVTMEVNDYVRVNIRKVR